MDNFKRTATLHIILGLLTSLTVLAAIVMGGLKLAEIGAGPSLSWGTIGVVLGVGFLFAILTVRNMFRAVDR